MFDYLLVEQDGLYQVVRHITLKDGESTSPVSSFITEREARKILSIYAQAVTAVFINDGDGCHTKIIESQRGAYDRE